jgi:hypothetical protein
VIKTHARTAFHSRPDRNVLRLFAGVNEQGVNEQGVNEQAVCQL